MDANQGCGAPGQMRQALPDENGSLLALEVHDLSAVERNPEFEENQPEITAGFPLESARCFVAH